MLDQVPQTLQSIILWATALAAAVALWKAGRKAHKAYKTVVTKAGHLYDSLAGFDEIVDPMSNVVLRPAVPGLNQRVGTIEVWQVQTMDTLKRLTALLEAQQDLSKRLDEHEQWSHEWIARHEHQFDDYHAATVARLDELTDKVDALQTSFQDDNNPQA